MHDKHAVGNIKAYIIFVLENKTSVLHADADADKIMTYTNFKNMAGYNFLRIIITDCSKYRIYWGCIFAFLTRPRSHKDRFQMLLPLVKFRFVQSSFAKVNLSLLQ